MGSFDLTRSERRGMIVLSVLIALTALIGAYDSMIKNKPVPAPPPQAATARPEAMERAVKAEKRDSAATRKRHAKGAKKEKKQPVYRDMLDEKTRK